MKTILTLCSIVCCLTFFSCVNDGHSVEYDDPLTLIGKWEQTISNKGIPYYMEFTSKTMKLYYEDKNKNTVYEVNGSYVIKGDSVYAKDLIRNVQRSFYYQFEHCNLVYFDSIYPGFIRIK